MSAASRRALELGRLARVADEPREANPYGGQTLAARAQRNLWWRGWDEADEEIRNKEEIR